MYGFFAEFGMKNGSIVQTCINIGALRKGERLIYETVAYMPDGTDFVMQEYESSWFAEQGHVAWQRMLNGK
jgi:hypothetical protein